MMSIEYSADASNVLDKFYRCDAIVYVEGDDDIPFWRIAFKVFANAEVEVQSVNGSEELDKVIKNIVAENLRIIAARDSDFTRLAGSAINDERIVYTYGYSIENSLYHIHSISEISSVMCRQYRADREACRKWMSTFFEKLKILIAYDVASHVFEKPFSAISDNCTRFMESAKSFDIDQAKLDLHIFELEKKLTNVEIDYAHELIAQHGIDFGLHLKGHFLASAAQKYLSGNIKAHGKGNSVPFDAMYASAIEFMRGNFAKVPGAEFYRSQINYAMEAMRE